MTTTDNTQQHDDHDHDSREHGGKLVRTATKAQCKWQATLSGVLLQGAQTPFPKHTS